MARVTGYGNKSPGRHGYGDGLLLQVSPKGKSTWYVRFKVDGKWTMRSIGEAGPTLNSTHARRRAADLIEQAKGGEVFLRSEQVGTRKLNRATLGGMVTHWADRMLQQGNWTERHRLLRHPSCLALPWFNRTANL